jgi:hypothetical protein
MHLVKKILRRFDMNQSVYTKMRPRLHGKRVQFCVSVDIETFDRIECSRGYSPRANFVAEIVRTALSGEKGVKVL